MRTVIVSVALAVLLLIPPSQSIAEIDEATVEAMWLFDDGGGNVLEDLSGHGRDGDLEGGTEWTDGRFGGGLKLDGSTGEVVITGYKGIGGTTPRTTVLWYKTDRPGDQRLVCWGANVNTQKYHVRLHEAPTALRVETQGGQLFATEPDLVDDEWHHLAVVLPPGSTMCHDHLLYVDGVQIKNTGGNNIGVNTDVTQNDVEIGYNKWIKHGNYAPGTFDEVAIFSVALSAADINAIMNLGLSGAASVSAKGKLATKWGQLKSDSAR